MANLSIGRSNAATLPLEGSVGHFSVGKSDDFASEDTGSLDVTYFLTYVGLNFGSGVDDQLLSHLAPVREVFDIRQLEFDELMQRDIDDARVSEELIPYLLDQRTGQMVKFFPPIVVMLLPVTDDRTRPAAKFPKVVKDVTPLDDEDYDMHVTRSGELGSEVFVLESPIVNGHTLNHDLTRLRVNPSRCRFVIVDGQHRAMALLALHRNMTGGWTDDRRSPYRDYYAHWTPELLSNYDLSQISLPIILCVVPELDSSFAGSYDLKQASRSIFLALNKNARKVSSSRNKLLDDNDLIAHFLRRVLSAVKHDESIDLREGDSKIPLWAVELDQTQNRTTITSAAAVTAVNHLYYAIEHNMLRDRLTRGLARRSGNFWLRTRVSLDRLKATDILSADLFETVKRDNYSAATADKLADRFMELYGRPMLELLAAMPTLQAHIAAFGSMRSDIERQDGPQMDRLIFGGQGMASAVEDHVQNLGRRTREEDSIVRSEDVAEVLNTFRFLLSRRSEHVARARGASASALLSELGGMRSENLDGAVLEIIDKCRTVAFQAAYVSTVLEIADRWAADEDDVSKASDLRKHIVIEYRDQVSEFFKPKTRDGLGQILKVFRGSGVEDELLTPAPKTNLRMDSLLLSSGELQPDKWPSYRLMFLEIWRPTDVELESYVARERAECRAAAMRIVYSRELKARAADEQVVVERLDDKARQECYTIAMEKLEFLVRALGGNELSPRAMETAVSDLAAAPSDQETD